MTRFLSIFFISLIGVSFFAGIRAACPDMRLTAYNYLKKNKLADITVVCSKGLSEDNIEDLKRIKGVELVMPLFSTDAMALVEDTADAVEVNLHLISMPFTKEEKGAKLNVVPEYDISKDPFPMNVPDITEGRLPETDREIALDERLKKNMQVSVGSTLRLSANGNSQEVTVTGFIESPKYISTFDRGNSSIGNGDSDGFGYLSGNTIGKLGSKMPLLAAMTTRYTEADILVEDAASLNCFEEEYTELIDRVRERLEKYGDSQEGTWYIRTREDNAGYLDYSENTERIEAVGNFFPLIFLLVAMLVALTTMTRMVEDQRIQMGTLKALGYSRGQIAMQYLLYAVLASLSGSLIGARFGFWLFPDVIVNSYGILYRLPGYHMVYWPDIAFKSIALIVGCVTVTSALACAATLREVPATLMRPKAPKPGKRVLLEYVGFIWNHLGFTTKVTIRNLFRYKKRFFMCVIGIAGSCGLLVTGFGLSDSIYGMIPEQFDRLWTVDLEVYTYDKLPLEEIRTLTDSVDTEGKLRNTAFCYDKMATAGTKEKIGTDIHVFVTEDPENFTKMIHLTDDNGQPISMTDSGVVISRKLAETYGLGAGDTISVKIGDDTYEAPVDAVTENYVYHYVYFTVPCYEQVTGEKAGFNCIFANVDGYPEAGETEKKAIEDDWNTRFLADSRVYLSMFLSDVYLNIYDALSVLNYVVWILIISAGALTFVVMLNLTNINITERRRELATLKVLGFTDHEMYDYVFRENVALAVIGTAVGLLFGTYLHRFLITTVEVDLVMFVRRVDGSSYVYSAILSILFALIVNLFMRRKVRAIDMVESLKSAE